MLTIFGATGYTGRLCAEEAVRRGIPLRIAGRHRDALEGLAATLGSPARVSVADASDPTSMLELAATSHVLLTTVGPYARIGHPVLEAALEGGARYVDVSGEVAFLEHVHRQGARARRAGVAVCPGFGFDGAPGDLLAGIAAARLGGPVQAVRVAYAVDGGAVSAGTLRSALDVAMAGGAAWADGRLVAEPVGVARWNAPFPDGTRPATSVPLPEVVTVGRSTGASRVRAYAATPAGGLGAAAARPGAALLRQLARTRAGGLMRRATRMVPPGPGPARRARTRATVVVEVAGPDGATTATARVADVYGTTARLAVGMCARLLDGRVDGRGVLTPTRALGGQAAGLLDEIGADWDCDSGPPG